jgi:hypothetical protein
MGGEPTSPSAKLIESFIGGGVLFGANGYPLIATNFEN